MVRHSFLWRPVRAPGFALPLQREAGRRLSTRAGPLSFVCFVGLSVGQPDDDLPRPQRPQGYDQLYGGRSIDAVPWWVIASGADAINHAEFLWQVYAKADPNYVGRVTVPVLWDRRRETIVNNESSEIIRMFDEWPGARGPLFRPSELASDIDALNTEIYPAVNNGVYRAGFATSQTAYEEAYRGLFATLDRLEARLGERSFLLGEQITEADWRLFTTLIRFDAVYYGHFKCNRDRLVDFPELWDYTRTLYQVPGVAETVHFDHIKTHYYGSHRTINPTGIIPVGPRIDYTAPTRRAVPKLGG